MKPVVRHIAFFFSALLVLCGTGSCIFKRDYSDPENDEKALFVLHIAPVNTRAVGGGDKVTEKIKSLRVIAVGERGIELNEKKDFEKAVSAQELSYFFSWNAEPGKKDFYIFANEESVGTIQYKSSGNLPSGLPMALSELLKQYDADQGDDTFTNAGAAETRADNKAAADDFKTVINSVYFEPDYRIDNQEIFLPYSAFYGDVELEGGSTIKKTMYLVPVATKFYFKFINNRDDDVQLWNVKIGGEVVEKTADVVGGVDFELDDKGKNVMVGGLNKANFLMAGIDEKSNDWTKEFADDHETYYWVDWLAKVSALSHDHIGSTGDNEDFNKTYGWISDYAMPSIKDAAPWSIVDIEVDKNKYPQIPGTTSKPTEDERQITMGPFYMPESKYEVTYEKTVTESGKTTTKTITEQRYTIDLYIHDTSSASAVGALDMEFAGTIGNVSSLFRNTYVIIVVTMSGKVDLNVYAEVIGWNAESVYGEATEVK